MTQLIGLLGKAGSGKDEAAKTMVVDHGFVQIAFAAKLKDILSDLYGIPRHYFEDRSLKNSPHPNLNGRTPRQSAQLIGTEGFRNLIDPSTWTNYAMRRASGFIARKASVVISDVRFREEFDAIRAAGGVIVHIDRSNGSCEHYDHESERHIDDLAKEADLVIKNHGTLEDLGVAVNREIIGLRVEARAERRRDSLAMRG